MTVRKSLIVLALSAVALPAAFASGGGATWVGGEAGFELHAEPSQLSREQVRSEFLRFRANPQTADGGTLVGGEAGYVPAQHSYAFVDGRLTHTDTIAHNTPKPSLAMTPQERQLHQQQYVN